MFSMRCYCQSGDWFSIRPSLCGTRTQSVLACIPTRSVGTRWFVNGRDVYIGPGWKHSLSNGIGSTIATRAISDSVASFATNKKRPRRCSLFQGARTFAAFLLLHGLLLLSPDAAMRSGGLVFNFCRFSSNIYDHRLDSGSPQAPPGMTVLVCRS